MTRIQESLMQLADPAYRDFHAKLIPDVDKNTILGVRIPVLRAFSKTLSKEETEAFYLELPHRYYDENALHSILLSKEKDFDSCLEKTEAFLPYIDNWATCDGLIPKVFEKNKDVILKKAEECIGSGRTYTIRFGIGLLMRHFLDGDFSEKIFDLTLPVQSDEYYVNMMLAWFYATALTKQWDATLPLIQNGKLSQWVHNKSIQKAVESYRISEERKTLLRTLRMK